MNYKVIENKKIKEFSFGPIKVKELLNDQAFENFSLAKITLDGANDLAFNKKSDLIYYILDGDGEFIIENQVFKVTAGDVVFIPKNTKCQDKGKMTLLAFSNPRFDPNNYEKVDR